MQLRVHHNKFRRADIWAIKVAKNHALKAGNPQLDASVKNWSNVPRINVPRLILGRKPLWQIPPEWLILNSNFVLWSTNGPPIIPAPSSGEIRLLNSEPRFRATAPSSQIYCLITVCSVIECLNSSVVEQSAADKHSFRWVHCSNQCWDYSLFACVSKGRPRNLFDHSDACFTNIVPSRIGCHLEIFRHSHISCHFQLWRRLTWISSLRFRSHGYLP